MIDGIYGSPHKKLQTIRPKIFIDSRDMYDRSVVGVDFYKNGAPHAQLNKVAGMPPSFNALIDPPLDKTKFSNLVASFNNSQIAGGDYTKNMVTRGQFLTLSPCKVKFGLTGDPESNTTEQIVSSQFIQLEKDSTRYWRLVNMYVRLSSMFLGLSGLMNDSIRSGIEVMNVPGFGPTLRDLNSIDLGSKGGDHGWIGLGGAYTDSSGNTSSILKAITNSDRLGDEIIPFYVDGIAEETLDGSNDIGESEISGNWKAKLQESVNNGSIGNILTEIVKNTSILGDNNLKTLLYNPLVPQIWKDFTLSQSYNVKFKFTAVGSDPFSILFFVLRPLAMLLPFIRPMAATTKTLNAYMSPFYCKAYSKGVMNVKEGIISQASISRDPLFTTTEGVPTALDVQITIIPLIPQQVQPSPESLFFQNETTWNKDGSAAMYLATLCGVNIHNMTIMDKIDNWLFGAKNTISNSFTGIIPTVKNIGTDFTDNFSVSKFF